MTCEEARARLHKVLVKMADYEWKSAQSMLADVYRELNESPADIHNNYNWYEGKIK